MANPKPIEQPLYDEEPLPFDCVSYSVTQKMIEPTGSPHVRSVSIYIPQLTGIPSVSIRIISQADPTLPPPKAGPALLRVSSLKIDNNVSGSMPITIAAQTLPPGTSPATGIHYCNIVAIGKP